MTFHRETDAAAESGRSAEPEGLRGHIRSRYAAVATGAAVGCGTGASSCCGPGDSASAEAERVGYAPEDLAAVPAGANLGLGCGHPTALGDLRPGEVVVDLGSGGGLDCFLAARAVGPSGRVIGVDMTPEMIERARRTAAENGRRNVEFRLGEIEHLPVADGSADVVISNCVINLVADKRAVFEEIMRVLKPAGRAYISDIALAAPLPESVRNDPDEIAGCVGGAILIEDYRRLVSEAGLEIEEFAVRGAQVSVHEAGGTVSPDPLVREAAAGAGAAAAAVRSVDLVARKARREVS